MQSVRSLKDFKMRSLAVVYPILLLFLVDVRSQTFPRVSFMGQTLANHSYMDFNLVGDSSSGSASVQCHTDLMTCCSAGQGNHRGDWYFPNGDRLPFSGEVFEQRTAQRVDLRHSSSGTSPVGIYRCEIPTEAVHDDDDTSVRDAPLYVGLYTASGGDVSISGGVVLAVVSDLNGASPQFTLTCISTGGPATTVTWTTDSTTVTDGNETVLNDPVAANYTHTLTVTGRLPGLYMCNVSNNKPSETASSINVLEASPPTTPGSMRLSHTSLLITWTLPSPLGDTSGYIIHYYQLGSTPYNDSYTITGGNSSSYVLTGLSSNSSYEIYLTGTSLHFPSNSIVFFGAPFLSVESTTVSSVSLSWTSGGSGNISYIVMWQKDSSVSDNVTITDGSTTTSYTVTELEENTEYHFTVTALDSSGGRGVSNTVSATTGLHLEVCLSGFFNCTEWVVVMPEAKKQDIVNKLLRQSYQSNTTASVEDAIVNGSLSCSSGTTNSVFFSAEIPVSSSGNSSNLETDIQNWVSDGRTVSVLGVLMSVTWGECSSCSDLTTGLCDREDFTCNSTQLSTEFLSVSPITTSPSITSDQVESTPVVCDCVQSSSPSSSDSLGLSVGVAVAAGLAVMLVAGAAVLIPFCILKHRHVGFPLKSDTAPDGTTIIPNIAYNSSAPNRERAFSADEIYDVIDNSGTMDTSPVHLRQLAEVDNDGSYEVGTPPNIRQMRSQLQRQKFEEGDRGFGP